jgi:serine/threonine protein kinase
MITELKGLTIIKIDIHNLDQLEAQDKICLIEFLREGRAKIKKNELYKIGDGVFLEFSHSLIKFCKNKSEKGYIYRALDGRKLGSGGFASVKESDTGISIESNGLIKVNEKHRAIKIQKIYEDADVDHDDKPSMEQRKKLAANEALIDCELFSSKGAKKTCTFRDFSETKSGAIKNGIKAYSCLALIDGITLKEYLDSKSRISHYQMIKIIIGILQELKRIQNKGHCHCDLKPENIMVDPVSGEIKELIDFATKTTINGKNFSEIMSPRYTPNNGCEPTSPTYDVYSLGRIIAKDILPKCIASEDKKDDILLKLSIQSIASAMQSANGIKLAEVLAHMLKINPRSRPSIEPLIYFFKSVLKEQESFRLSLINEATKYLTERTSDTRQYRNSLFHFSWNDRKTKRETVVQLILALQNKNEVLQLTMEQDKAIRQGDLGKIFPKVSHGEFFNVEISHNKLDTKLHH